MDIGSLSPKNSEVSKNQQPSKKRKVVEKTVIKVKIGTNVGKLLKNECPPSDSWSWRKYGQKPIKGSPYPRGYYRCSTSKGCSAKKQVERCKSDDSFLIITYTSSHNHPGPNNDHHHDHHDLDPLPPSPKQDQPIITSDHDHHDIDDHIISSNNFHYIVHESPLNYGLELDHFSTNTTTSTTIEKTCCDGDTNKLGLEVDKLEPPLIISGQTQKQPMCNFSSSSSSDQEISDFFDELEELPMYSNFTSLIMRTNLSNEIRNTIPIVPS